MDKHQKELLVVQELRKDSRITLTELRKKTGMPISTLHEIMKRQDLIRKRTCILDFEKLGLPVLVCMLMRARKNSREMLCGFLKEHGNVNNVHRTNSGYDYIVEGAFRNIKDLESFIEQANENGARHANVYHMMEELKNQELTIPEY